MSTSTDESAGLAGLMVPRVATSLKCPRTVIMPKCLAENSTCVCIGSICQAISQYLPVSPELSRVGSSHTPSTLFKAGLFPYDCRVLARTRSTSTAWLSDDQQCAWRAFLMASQLLMEQLD